MLIWEDDTSSEKIKKQTISHYVLSSFICMSVNYYLLTNILYQQTAYKWWWLWKQIVSKHVFIETNLYSVDENMNWNMLTE